MQEQSAGTPAAAQESDAQCTAADVSRQSWHRQAACKDLISKRSVVESSDRQAEDAVQAAPLADVLHRMCLDDDMPDAP